MPVLLPCQVRDKCIQNKSSCRPRQGWKPSGTCQLLDQLPCLARSCINTLQVAIGVYKGKSCSLGTEVYIPGLGNPGGTCGGFSWSIPTGFPCGKFRKLKEMAMLCEGVAKGWRDLELSLGDTPQHSGCVVMACKKSDLLWGE